VIVPCVLLASLGLVHWMRGNARRRLVGEAA